MKKCKNCGAILEDNALFCDECGTHVPHSVGQEDITLSSISSGATQQVTSQFEQSGIDEQQVYTEQTEIKKGTPKQNNVKMATVIAAIVMVLVAIILIGWGLWPVLTKDKDAKKNLGNPDTQKQTEVVEESQMATATENTSPDGDTQNENLENQDLQTKANETGGTGTPAQNANPPAEQMQPIESGQVETTPEPELLSVPYSNLDYGYTVLLPDSFVDVETISYNGGIELGKSYMYRENPDVYMSVSAQYNVLGQSVVDSYTEMLDTTPDVTEYSQDGNAYFYTYFPIEQNSRGIETGYTCHYCVFVDENQELTWSISYPSDIDGGTFDQIYEAMKEQFKAGQMY